MYKRQVWFCLVQAHKKTPEQPADMDAFFLGDRALGGRVFQRIRDGVQPRYARNYTIDRKKSCKVSRLDDLFRSRPGFWMGREELDVELAVVARGHARLSSHRPRPDYSAIRKGRVAM